MSVNVPSIPDYMEDTDYEVILSNYLGNVRDDVDKREGSIIWDAGAPCCIEIAKAYVYLYAMVLNCFASTAEAPYIDYRAEEVGLERDKSTYASRLGTFTDGNNAPFSIAMGTSFSTINETTLVNFTITSVYTVDGVTVPGSYILKCDTAGTVGNEYFGAIVPVHNINGLATATLTDILIPGEEQENTETLRLEYFRRVKTKSFNGNVAAYKELVTSIEGVGSCQVYPAVLGDMTIKLSILDSNYNKASETLVTNVAKALDPYYDDSNYAGQGLGLAPIDHKTVAVTGTELTVNISATLTLDSGVTLQAILPTLTANIESYFLQLRKGLAEGDELNKYKCSVYLAKIQSYIVNTQGVANITNLKLNNVASDVVLTETKALQQIPIKGVLTFG